MIPANLPIHEVIADIRDGLSRHNRLILQAPPGAGKTTAVPLSLLNEPWLENKLIIMLEPRRLAARTSAARMAELLGESVGERIGYQIRSEKRLSEKTKILVVTEGILTRRLQNDPSLENIALIIFDEFHERHLHSDLSLAFALQSQAYLREDLKILVMSATLDTQGLDALMDFPPVITSEGRSFPVTLTYLPPNTPAADPKNIVPRLYSLICEVWAKESGDILVFLPGVREIKSLESLLQNNAHSLSSDCLIVPLYGDLSKEEQERALKPAKVRKVILATNIAETSLTIEGVRIVIDSGYERTLRFDASSGMERLVTQKISRASAAQRAGRAGRTCEGSCYRLWSEIAHRSLSPHSEPEIMQCDLTPLALELCAWGALADELAWIDPPPPHALAHAYTLLDELGALHTPTRISPHGVSVLSLGLHPRLAHLILAAQSMGFESEAVLLSTLLSERDPLIGADACSTDLRERFWLLCDALQNRPIPPYLKENLHHILNRARETAKRMGTSLKLSDAFSEEKIAVLLAMAYPDRIARSRESANGRYLMAGGKEAVLDARDDLSGSEWLVIARSDGQSKASRIYLCAPIESKELKRHFEYLFVTEPSVSWNPQTQRVEARETKRLGAIILDSHPIECSDPEHIGAKLCEGIRLSGLEALPWSDRSRALIKRLRTFHHYGEIAEDFTDSTLLNTLESWLMPHFGTHTSLRDLQSLDLYTIFASAIAWDTLKRLDRLLPETYAAPGGSTVAIDYCDPGSPVLAVRIQEVFGLKEHPCVMEGRLPLSLHLLSPARRPIQMTRDLIGFWDGSYTDVKKELKGRYPKHYWPDDPYNAHATNRTKKFMDS